MKTTGKMLKSRILILTVLLGCLCSSIHCAQKNLTIVKSTFIEWPFNDWIQEISTLPDGNLFVWYGGRESMVIDAETKKCIGEQIFPYVSTYPQVLHGNATEPFRVFSNGTVMQHPYLAVSATVQNWNSCRFKTGQTVRG